MKLLDQLIVLYDSLPGDICKLSEIITKLVKEVKDAETTTYAIEKLMSLFVHKESHVKTSAMSTLKQISEVSDDEAIKSKALTKLACNFADEDEKVRYSAHNAFALLFERVQDKKFKTQELGKIKNDLKAGKNKTRFYAGEALLRISKGIQKEELITQVFEEISKFLADTTWKLRGLAVALVAKFPYKLDKQYQDVYSDAVRKIMALIPASHKMTDDEHKFLGTIIFAVPELTEGLEDDQLIGEILTKSYLNANDFESKTALNAIVKKASQKRSLINKVLYHVGDHRVRWHNKTIAKKNFDIVHKLSKEDKTVAIGYFEIIPELLTIGTISPDLVCSSIDEIIESLGDATLINEVFEKTITLFFGGSDEAQNGSRILLQQLKRSDFQNLLELKVKSLIKSIDVQDSQKSLFKLISIPEVKVLAAKALGKAEQVIKLFSNENCETRKCAIKLAVEVLKQGNDMEKAEVIDKILNLVKDTDLGVQITAIEVLPDLIETIKDEKQVLELVEQLLSMLTNARRDENFDVRVATMKALLELTNIVKDKALLAKMAEHIIQPLLQQRAFGNHDLDAMIICVNTCKELIKNVKNKEKAIELTENLLNVFTDEDSVFTLKELRSIAKRYFLLRIQKEQFIEEADEDEIIKNALNSNAKRMTIRAVKELIDTTQDEKILPRLGLAVEYKLANNSLNKTIILIEDIGKLLEIVNSAIHSANYEVAEKILKTLGNKKLAHHAFKTLAEELNDTPLLFVHSNLSLLMSASHLIDDQELLNKGYQQVKAKFDSLVEPDQAKDRHFAARTLSRISIASKDQGLMAKTVNMLVDYLLKDGQNAHSKGHTIEKIIHSTCKKIEDKDFIISKFEQLLSNKERDAVRGFIVDGLLSSEDIIKYLKYSDFETKNLMEWVLKEFFNKFLLTFNQMEELLKDRRSLTIDMIVKKLFKGGLEKSEKNEIESALMKFKEGSTNSQEILKSTLVLYLKLTHQIMDHQVIGVVLSTIGYEGASAGDADERELFEAGRRVLDHEAKNLDHEGLQWINQNFSTLATLSAESKPFFKRVYHQLVEDLKITPLEQEIVIKCINQGLTTSISRRGEIIFEGKYYVKKDQSAGVFFEGVVKAVINQEKDILVPQYKLHKPLFPQSTTTGMKKAAIDVELVESLVNKTYRLSSDDYVLSRLCNDKQKIVLLEERSAVGDHIIYNFNFTNNKYELIRINPANTETNYRQSQLEKVFGKYVIGRTYQGKSKLLTPEEASNIITNNVSELDEILKNLTPNEQETDKEYFQQELLGLGNSDKIDYIYKRHRANKLIEEKIKGSLLKKRTEKETSQEEEITKEYAEPDELSKVVVTEERKKCCCTMF